MTATGFVKTVTSKSQKDLGELVFVTPELAMKWLGNMIHNRTLRPREVKKYVSQFQAGTWEADPLLPILFNKSGQLADGQHRLNAVIEFNRGVTFYVRTVPDEILNALANTIPRVMRDRLHMIGCKNATTVSSIAAALLQRKHFGALQVRKQQTTRSFTPEDILEVIDQVVEGGGVYESADHFINDVEYLYGLQPKRARLLTPKHIGYLLAQNHDVRNLLCQVCNEEAPQNESSRSIRKHLMNWNRLMNSQHYEIFVVTKTWNKGPMRSYRLDSDGIHDLNGSIFPKIWPAEF